MSLADALRDPAVRAAVVDELLRDPAMRNAAIEALRDPAWAAEALASQRDLFQPRQVTSLPAGATAGTVVDYVTSGVVWRLVKTGISSQYPWSYVGGPALGSFVATAETQTATTTWGDLTTPGPTVTVPLAGDYTAAGKARAVNTNAGANRGRLGIAQGAGTPASDVGEDTAATGHHSSLAIDQAFLGLDAGTELRLRYYSVLNGNTWDARSLLVLPVRVG